MRQTKSTSAALASKPSRPAVRATRATLLAAQAKAGGKTASLSAPSTNALAKRSSTLPSTARKTTKPLSSISVSRQRSSSTLSTTSSSSGSSASSRKSGARFMDAGERERREKKLLELRSRINRTRPAVTKPAKSTSPTKKLAKAAGAVAPPRAPRTKPATTSVSASTPAVARLRSAASEAKTPPARQPPAAGASAAPGTPATRALSALEKLRLKLGRARAAAGPSTGKQTATRSDAKTNGDSVSLAATSPVSAMSAPSDAVASSTGSETPLSYSVSANEAADSPATPSSPARPKALPETVATTRGNQKNSKAVQEEKHAAEDPDELLGTDDALSSDTESFASADSGEPSIDVQAASAHRESPLDRLGRIGAARRASSAPKQAGAPAEPTSPGSPPASALNKRHVRVQQGRGATKSPPGSPTPEMMRDYKSEISFLREQLQHTQERLQREKEQYDREIVEKNEQLERIREQWTETEGHLRARDERVERLRQRFNEFSEQEQSETERLRETLEVKEAEMRMMAAKSDILMRRLREKDNDIRKLIDHIKVSASRSRTPSPPPRVGAPDAQEVINETRRSVMRSEQRERVKAEKQQKIKEAGRQLGELSQRLQQVSTKLRDEQQAGRESSEFTDGSDAEEREMLSDVTDDEGGAQKSAPVANHVTLVDAATMTDADDRTSERLTHLRDVAEEKASQLVLLRRELDAANVQSRRNDMRILELEDQNMESKRRVEVAENSVKKKEERISGLVDKLVRANEQIHALEEKVELLERKLEATRKGSNASQDELQRVQAEHEAALAEAEALRGEIAAERTRGKSLADQVELLTAQLAALQEQHSMGESETSKMRNDYELRLADLQREAEALRKTHERANQRAEERESDVEKIVLAVSESLENLMSSTLRFKSDETAEQRQGRENDENHTLARLQAQRRDLDNELVQLEEDAEAVAESADAAAIQDALAVSRRSPAAAVPPIHAQSPSKSSKQTTSSGVNSPVRSPASAAARRSDTTRRRSSPAPKVTPAAARRGKDVAAAGAAARRRTAGVVVRKSAESRGGAASGIRSSPARARR